MGNLVRSVGGRACVCPSGCVVTAGGATMGVGEGVAEERPPHIIYSQRG